VFPDKVVCDLGLRGDTLQGMKNRAEQVKLLKPKKVYLTAGINDVASKSVDEFGAQFETLLRRLRDQSPTAELIVFNLLSVNDKVFTISCNNE
jgi:lysophospholipase L1-like esterase